MLLRNQSSCTESGTENESCERNGGSRQIASINFTDGSKYRKEILSKGGFVTKWRNVEEQQNAQ